MSPISVSQARKDLYNLVDEVGASHKPLIITGKRSNAVLISYEDWSAIQETLYLTSIPGMAESIAVGLKTPTSECSKQLNW